MQGKTIVITGASRGIGEAIAIKFSQLKANVVVLAKDSLKNVEEKIKSQKGSYLGLTRDLCSEIDIQNSIRQTIATFGSIDVLINNIASFCFLDSLNITGQQFDDLISTNLRATFLMSKYAIPYLEKSENPHIINISPPLNMHSNWFSRHVAFTLSKYAMSMCTLGMSEEFKHKGIAINSLWPETTIATSTIKDNFKSEVITRSRLPTIMADAAVILAQKDAKICTGNFFIDEDLLREFGVEDFSLYAVDPTKMLFQDLFVTKYPAACHSGKMVLEKENYLSPILKNCENIN